PDDGSADPERFDRIGRPLTVGARDELVRIVADEKNGPAFDWHDLENHFENARLKLLRLFDAINGRADSQQRRQIAGEPDIGRKVIGDTVGPDANRILPIHFYGNGGNELAVERVAERNAGGRVVFTD